MEADARHPTEFLARLGRVAEQGFDLGVTEIARRDQTGAGVGVIALLVDALPFPA